MAGHNTLQSPLIGPPLRACMCVCQCVLFRYLSADTALVPNHTKTHTANEGLREGGGGERWSEWRRKVRGRLSFPWSLSHFFLHLSRLRGLSLTSPHSTIFFFLSIGIRPIQGRHDKATVANLSGWRDWQRVRPAHASDGRGLGEVATASLSRSDYYLVNIMWNLLI